MGIVGRLNHLDYIDDIFGLDAEFLKVIDGDQKEKFILEIDWKINKFRSLAQEILGEVLDCSSIKCAEALITGQTPLAVEHIKQNQLETIGLLAGMTKETEEVFLEYAVQGKIIEFASLLMVAHKKLNNVMHKVHQCLDSIENNNPPIWEDQKEKLVSMKQLVEVFERAGDDISSYLKEDKFYVSKYQTILDVTRLLVEAGFQLQQSDADLSCYGWFESSYDTRDRDAPYEDRRRLDDFGMAHYSKSGYRW